MDRDADPLTWRQVAHAVRRQWVPLVTYELVVSLVAAALIGPVALALSYQVIGLQSETPLGNWDLFEFLLSPLGALGFVSAASLMFGRAFIEYSGLIVLADAALRGSTLSARQVIAAMTAAAPRLLGLAILHTGLAIVVALPFIGVAAATYGYLLADADINYYLSERPPRFWIALGIGIVLAVACAISALWFFVRWALAVPACVLDGQSWLSARSSSIRLMRGRAWRLLGMFGGWQLFNYLVLLIATAGLDWCNKALFARFEGQLSLLVGSTVILLLLDSVALLLLGALFAIGLAVLIAREYEAARRGQDATRPFNVPSESASLAPQPTTWRVRAGVTAIALAGPLVSLAYVWTLASELVEYRPARVTGHRAGPKPAPENSLAALNLAIAAGADFVEIDVQLTSDGQIVLLHDRDLRRVTGDPRDLQQASLADLRNLRLRANGEATDEIIPTLAEFLAVCGDRIRLNIELKETSRHPGLATAVVKELHERGFTKRAVVSCFELPPLAEVRQAEPELPVGIIVSASRGDLTRMPVNFLSLNQRLVQAGLVRRAHQRGMEVHAWTVNSREVALRMLDLGCDNLITSDPVLMREVVDWYSQLGEVERMLLRVRRWIRD